jgi:hypothetical protein
MHRRVEVYLDESGGLGRSPRSPQHMVAAALSTRDPVALRRLIRKANRRFGPRENRLGEVKFSTASRGLRMHVIEGIARSDVTIAYAAVHGPNLHGSKVFDRESLIASLFEEVVEALSSTLVVDHVSIVMDRRRVRDRARGEFDCRLIGAVMSHHAGFFPPDVKVTHLDSQTSEGLQAADFVAGAMFQNLERENSLYLGILAPRVVHYRLRR